MTRDNHLIELKDNNVGHLDVSASSDMGHSFVRTLIRFA